MTFFLLFWSFALVVRGDSLVVKNVKMTSSIGETAVGAAQRATLPDWSCIFGGTIRLEGTMRLTLNSDPPACNFIRNANQTSMTIERTWLDFTLPNGVSGGDSPTFALNVSCWEKNCFGDRSPQAHCTHTTSCVQDGATESDQPMISRTTMLAFVANVVTTSDVVLGTPPSTFTLTLALDYRRSGAPTPTTSRAATPVPVTPVSVTPVPGAAPTPPPPSPATTQRATQPGVMPTQPVITATNDIAPTVIFVTDPPTDAPTEATSDAGVPVFEAPSDGAISSQLIGIIVGAAVGSVCCLLLGVLIAVVVLRRKQKRTALSSALAADAQYLSQQSSRATPTMSAAGNNLFVSARQTDMRSTVLSSSSSEAVPSYSSDRMQTYAQQPSYVKSSYPTMEDAQPSYSDLQLAPYNGSAVTSYALQPGYIDVPVNKYYADL
jgi:hypothetical protein